MTICHDLNCRKDCSKCIDTNGVLGTIRLSYDTKHHAHHGVVLGFNPIHPEAYFFNEYRKDTKK